MATQTYTNAVTLTDATEFNRFDIAAYPVLASVTGTNTVTATGPANYSLNSNMPPLILIPANTNTGATTLAITPSGGAALAAKNVFSGGAALTGGELVASVPCVIEYDGTQYNICGQSIRTASTATTFTFDGSGGTTASQTIITQKIGSFVWIYIPGFSGTSGTSSTKFTANTAIPAAFRPATLSQGCNAVPITNNNASSTQVGFMTINTSGILTIYRDITTTATFTNSSTCGVAQAFSFTYNLA